MNLYSWDYYDLEKEMQGASVGKLLELFKREEESFTEKCIEYANNVSKLNEEGRKALEDEYKFLEGAKIKIALKIAESLTK